MNHKNKIIWLFIFTQIVIGCQFGESDRSKRALRAKKTTEEQKKKNAEIKALADEKARAEAKAKAEADQLNKESLKDLSVNHTHCDSDIKSMQFKRNDQKYELILVDQVPNGKTDKQQVKSQAILNWNESKKEIEVIHNDLSDTTQTSELINFNQFSLFLEKENNKSEVFLKLKDAQDKILIEKSELKKTSEAHQKICDLIKSSPLALFNRDLAQLVLSKTESDLVQNLSAQLKDKDNKTLGRVTLLITSEEITLIIQNNNGGQDTVKFQNKIGPEEIKLKDVGVVALNAENQVVLKISKQSLINSKLGITQEEEMKDIVLQVITTVTNQNNK